MTLLDHDLLVMQQARSFLRNDFAVTDDSGTQVGRIHTDGAALSRMFLGSRKFTIYDGDDAAVVRLDDVMGIGRDRFAILDADGRDLGTLVKEFSLLRKRLTVHLATGEQLDVQGRFFDFDYDITGPGGVAAQVGRRWGGIANSLLGRDRYVVSMTPGVPRSMRAAIVATTVALDLIRAKEQTAAASSSSS